jgi:hypothetical protein
MSDQAAFARFQDGWEQDGVDEKTGMPRFRPQLYIRFTRPPYQDNKREATDDDIDAHPEEYKLYLKLKGGREIDKIEGFPLALWPALAPSEFDQLVAHGILTVEQLAKMADRKTSKVPEAFMALAARAKRMVEMQKDTGRYEAVIEQLRQERDQLKEQVTELGGALSAANAQINALTMRMAGIGAMLPERAA